MRNNYSHSHKITSDTGMVSYQPCYGQHDWMKKVDWKGYLSAGLVGAFIVAVAFIGLLIQTR